MTGWRSSRHKQSFFLRMTVMMSFRQSFHGEATRNLTSKSKSQVTLIRQRKDLHVASLLRMTVGVIVTDKLT